MSRWFCFLALIALCSCSGVETSDVAMVVPGPTIEELTADTDAALAEMERHLDRLVSVQGPRTLENTLVPYNDIEISLSVIAHRVWSLSELHPSEELRECAADLGKRVDSVWNELSLNRDVYSALVELPEEGLDPDSWRVRQLALREFKRSGVDRDPTTRDRIKKIREKLTELTQEFSKNISDDVRTIVINSVTELDGLPQDYINTHPPDDDGKIRITTAYPEALPVLRSARNPEVRKRVFMEFFSRGYPKNEKVLEDMLQSRYELARLLGHSNWASYASETMMIRNAPSIRNFIDKVAAVTRKRAEKEDAEVLAEKQRDYPDATHLDPWDGGYYSDRLRKRKYSFDSQKLRPYFQYESVKKGILELYEELFELKMTPVEADTWHPTVESFDVTDSARGDRYLGRFHLDMHPRAGKYTHAAMFTWRTGVKDRHHPEMILVCNFPDPANPPALMSHGQVVTFFHEFGHLLDALFAGHNRWNTLSRGVQEWDFVEAPSQMLEEWIHDPVVLARFARHYQTGEPIPSSLIEAAGRARSFGRGVGIQQQLFYSALSYRYHASDPSRFDLLELLKETQKEYSVRPYVEGTHFHTSFGHLAGYTSNYYTYMWSLVIARDLLSMFRGPDGKLDLMDKDMARRYREKILEPGGTKSANDLVKDFLGRPYSAEAFERWLSE